MRRREARSEILKALYRLEFVGDDHMLNNTDDYGPQRDFIQSVFQGTVDRMEELDEIIDRFASGWSIDRLAPVDRNILRMSIFELMYYEETPAEVVINEAVELSKKYGTDNAPSFVNGILDRLWKEEPQV